MVGGVSEFSSPSRPPAELAIIADLGRKLRIDSIGSGCHGSDQARGLACRTCDLT